MPRRDVHGLRTVPERAVVAGCSWAGSLRGTTRLRNAGHTRGTTLPNGVVEGRDFLTKRSRPMVMARA
jgi:hypothetical protein